MSEKQLVDAELTNAPTELAKVRHQREAMAVSQQRRELIGRELVQCQAAFIFVSLRQAILNLPSKSAHIESHDARQAMEVLAKAAHEFLTELSNFLRSALIQAGWKRPASGAEIQREQAKAKARRASKTETMRKLHAEGRSS